MDAAILCPATGFNTGTLLIGAAVGLALGIAGTLIIMVEVPHG